MIQSKKQNKSLKINPKKMEVCKFPKKEFKITVIKKLDELRKMMCQQK